MGYKFKFPTFDSFMRSIELHGSTSKCLITESEGLGKLIELYHPSLIETKENIFLFIEGNVFSNIKGLEIYSLN